MDDVLIVCFGVISTLVLAAWCLFLCVVFKREEREMDERANQADQWHWERWETTRTTRDE